MNVWIAACGHNPHAFMKPRMISIVLTNNEIGIAVVALDLIVVMDYCAIGQVVTQRSLSYENMFSHEAACSCPRMAWIPDNDIAPLDPRTSGAYAFERTKPASLSINVIPVCINSSAPFANTRAISWICTDLHGYVPCFGQRVRERGSVAVLIGRRLLRRSVFIEKHGSRLHKREIAVKH